MADSCIDWMQQMVDETLQTSSVLVSDGVAREKCMRANIFHPLSLRRSSVQVVVVEDNADH